MGMMNETKALRDALDILDTATIEIALDGLISNPVAQQQKVHRMAEHLIATADTCEICEERPATTTAKFVDARLCQDCADTEPGIERCASCGLEWGVHDYQPDAVICPAGDHDPQERASEDVR